VKNEVVIVNYVQIVITISKQKTNKGNK
jgi:hypothetical protein